MSSGFDPYYTWLGIPPADQPPHHYRLLGINPFEENPTVIEHAADRQMAHLRNFQAGKHSALSQKLLNEVAAAKICLLKSEKKVAYDAQLRELLNRQSSGEDTSSELQALRALDQLIGDDLARPVLQRKRQRSNLRPWLAVGVGAAVLLVGVVAWKLLGTGGMKVGEKAESGSSAERTQPKAEVATTSSGPAGASESARAANASKSAERGGVLAPEGRKTIAQGASPGERSQEPQKAPEGRKESSPGAAAGTPNTAPGATAGLPSSAMSSPQSPPSNPHSLARAESGKPKAEETTDDHREHRGTQREKDKRPSSVSSVTSVVPSSPQSRSPSPQSLVPAVSKRPIPTVADQEKSKKAAQDLFRDDYAKAKKPSERADLARTILKKGTETREPAADHYALLCLARDVAVSADDDRLACEAIDEIAKSFDADPLAMKADALTALAKSARATLALHKTLCERALALGQEALDGDSLDLADALAKLAFNEAGKLRDKDLVQRSRALAKDQQEAAKAFSAVEEAFKTLKEKPDNPAANLAVGKYLCFVKGDWPKGLPHLTKSDDAKLNALAGEEWRATPPPWEPAPGVAPPDPPQPAAALKLADAWWDAGEAASGKQRDRIVLHAGYWYRQSFGSSTTALAATKINARLEQIDKTRRQYPAPPPAVAPFDVKEARLHQRRWADYLGVPLTCANSIRMKLVFIPPGEFGMGAPPEEIAWTIAEAERTNQPQSTIDIISTCVPLHRVTVSKPFYLGICEVTQVEYEQIMGGNPSSFSPRGANASKLGGKDTSRHPVDTVSWNDAADFCHRIDQMPAERAARRKYRLPTEAEWEYSSRAGSTAKWFQGIDEVGLVEVAWFRENSGGATHPAGHKRPNPWGLYDMQGNVWEWCMDWYAADYYRKSPKIDPTGPTDGGGRVLRGAPYYAYAYNLSCAWRHALTPTRQHEAQGFRVVCPLDLATIKK
jgi:formylglycine-generating enzyme required for sulfatase activity